MQSKEGMNIPERATEIMLWPPNANPLQFPNVTAWEILDDFEIKIITAQDSVVIARGMAFTIVTPSEEDIKRSKAIKAMQAKAEAAIKDANIDPDVTKLIIPN